MADLTRFFFFCLQLLAHEFLFDHDMIHGSNGQVIYAVVCMLFGAGIMALLGRWA